MTTVSGSWPYFQFPSLHKMQTCLHILVNIPPLNSTPCLQNISSTWIDPLIIMQCPSLFLVRVFVLKSILSDRSIVTLAFFWCPFAWNTFFHLLTFSLCVSLDLKSLLGNIYMGLVCVCVFVYSLGVGAVVRAGLFNSGRSQKCPWPHISSSEVVSFKNPSFTILYK